MKKRLEKVKNFRLKNREGAQRAPPPPLLVLGLKERNKGRYCRFAEYFRYCSEIHCAHLSIERGMRSNKLTRVEGTFYSVAQEGLK